MFAVRGCGTSRRTHFSSSRVLWSRASRGFPVKSSSCSFGGRFSGNVTSLSSLQLRSTHWRKSGKKKTWPAEVVQVVLMLCCRRISLTIHCTMTAKCRNYVCLLFSPKHLQWTRASSVAQLVKNPPAMQETWVWSLRQEDPLEKEMATHSSTLAWRIPQRSLAGYSPWGRKESEMTEWLHHHHYPVTPEHNQC